MRVFVAGANGAVGRRLVPMLVAHGHRVTGTTTSEASVDAVRALGAEPVVVDGLDGAAIGEAVARAEPDAIIHEMTALSGTPDFRHFDRWFALTNRLRTEGTEHLLAAAQASGVQAVRRPELHRLEQQPDRLVDQDRGRSVRRAPGRGADRDARGDPVPRAGRARRAARGDRRPLRRALRPGLVGHARRDPPQADVPGDRQRRRASCPRPTSTTPPAGRWPPWSAAGGASTTSSTTIRRRPASSSRPSPRRSARRQPLRIPAWLGRLLAGEVAVTMMTEGRGSSNAKAKRELGWRPIWPTLARRLPPRPRHAGAAGAACGRQRCEAQARRRDPRRRTREWPRPMSSFGRCCSRSRTGCSPASAGPRTSSRRRSSATSRRSTAAPSSSRRRRGCRPS